jgi:hypothetical protein
VTAEPKALRLHGMAGAWADLAARGGGVGVDSSRWLIGHLLQAEGSDRAMHSVSYQMGAARFSAISDARASHLDVHCAHIASIRRADLTAAFAVEALAPVRCASSHAAPSDASTSSSGVPLGVPTSQNKRKRARTLRS